MNRRSFMKGIMATPIIGVAMTKKSKDTEDMPTKQFWSDDENCDHCGGKILPRSFMTGTYNNSISGNPDTYAINPDGYHSAYIRVLGVCNSCGDTSIHRMGFPIVKHKDYIHDGFTKYGQKWPKEALVWRNT